MCIAEQQDIFEFDVNSNEVELILDNVEIIIGSDDEEVSMSK